MKERVVVVVCFVGFVEGNLDSVGILCYLVYRINSCRFNLYFIWFIVFVINHLNFKLIFR